MAQARKSNNGRSFPVQRSLAFAKFEHSMDLESRHYWNLLCAIGYTNKWWNSTKSDKHPSVLHEAIGDNVDPYKRVPLSPTNYLKALDEARNIIRQNQIISFVAIFENYLCDVIQRTIFLEPERLRKSKAAAESAENTLITINELLEPAKSGQFLYWLSKNLAEKFQRGMTHAKLIEKLNSLIQHGINKDSQHIIKWIKYERLRNAIAHSSRRVTGDLASLWSDRFTKIGQSIVLEDGDIADISALARTIASSIDRMFMANVVREQDDILLVREIYIRYGIEDAAKICQIVESFTKSRMESKTIRDTVHRQKKTGASIDGYDFDRLFSLFDEATAALVERCQKFV